LIGDASDADNLKKVLVSDFLGAGGGNLGDTNLTLSGATVRTYNVDGNELRFINGATSLFKIHPNTVVVGGGTPIAGTIFLSRGTGNTAGTKSFRAESNNGLNYFEVLDDATTLLKGASTVVSKTIQSTSASGFSSLILNNNIGGLGGYIRHANSTGLFEYTSISSQIFRVSDSSHYKFSFAGGGDAFTDLKLTTSGLVLGVGIGATTPLAKLHVEGAGSTSATSGLLVKSADGFKSFEFVNDGTTFLKSSNTVTSHAIQSTSASGLSSLILNNAAGTLGGYIRYSNASTNFEYTSLFAQVFRVADSSHYKFSFAGGGDAFTDMKLDSTGLLLGTGIGATTIGAKLHVIGSTLLNGNLGVFGTTPIAQPTTGHAAATFVANTSGIADDTATFDGYTIGQIVKALRDLGALT
jgi:hypothetical protein